MIYTGIGARQTPSTALADMQNLATNLELCGFILRSGGADGADSAFEAGVSEEDHKEIYLPWKGFNGSQSSRYHISDEAYDMAEHYHPAWNRCSQAARKFHARNCYQILGDDLGTPTDFVMCWTPNGKVTGGTGQALRIAIDRDIPIINMGVDNWADIFDDVVFPLIKGED
jgi:hypothetical protein